jgi:dipeptidyl aminopeptidase/acylaminoacyl peptidase
MRPARWLVVLATLCLLASLSPVYAADPSVEIINVGTEDKPIDLPQVLSDEEVARIDQLQNGAQLNSLLSPLSPDETTAWAVLREELGFFNVQDGSFRPVSLDIFGQRLLPSAFLGFVPLAWFDGDTIGGLGLDLSAESLANAVVLITLNRNTAAVNVQPLNADALNLFFEDNFFPIVFAPNATKVAAAIIEELPDEEAPEMVRVQVGLPRPQDSLLNRTPATQQARVDALSPRNAQRHAKFNTLLEQQADRSILQVTPTRTRLVVLDLLTGEFDELNELDQASLLFAAAWSRDSNQLALTVTGFPDLADEPRYTFDGALLSEELYKDVTGQLPPAENPYLQNNVVTTYDLGTGEQRSVRAADGDGAFLYAYDWSPDGQTILMQGLIPARLPGRSNPIYTFQFVERYDYRFYNRDLQETGRLSLPQLFSGPGIFGFNLASMASPDELIFTALSVENTHPYYYNRVSGELRNLADRAGTYLLQAVAPASRQVIYRATSYTSPSDIYRVGWDGKGITQLSRVNDELRQSIKITQHPVSFTLRNGQVRRGTLVLPEGVAYPPKNIPIVVWQEGGPGGAMNNLYQAIVERPFALLPSFGFGFLSVPLSGREGYDAATLNALAVRTNYGSIDIDEQAEIVRQMISRGWTSRGKVGITGCSYGGYFAWQSIIRHPDLYAAANPQCALVDNVTEWTRGFRALMPYLQGPPTPYTAGAEYRADSPSYNAAKVRTPVLAFHGSFDFLPVVQNENLHLALVGRKATSRFLKFIGAGHGLVAVDSDMPEDADIRFESYGAQEQIQWFRTYLK